MPELFRMFGLRFHFWSREHEPIHVHVENSDGEAIYSISSEGVLLKENYKIKPKDLKLAESILEENKDLILFKWKKYFKDNK